MPLDRNEVRAAGAGTPRRAGGFTLIEILIVVALAAILLTVAYPSYRDYTVRSSRSAAQTELVELSSMQEKIYLNSNAYTNSVTAAYNGASTGGLGKTTGRTSDNKYTLALTVT